MNKIWEEGLRRSVYENTKLRVNHAAFGKDEGNGKEQKNEERNVDYGCTMVGENSLKEEGDE